MSDLWPKELDDVSDSLPVTPVMEQAELLAKHTGNLVKAEVIPLDADDDVFRFDFDLVVRVLDYRFTLFTFHYGVQGYPVFFVPYSKVASELGLQRIQMEDRFTAATKADNAEELLEDLGGILRSNTTKSILQTLVAQAQKFKR